MSRKNTILSFLLILMTASCTTPKNGDKEKEIGSAVAQDKPAEVKAFSLKYSTFSYELVSNGTVSALRKADLKFQSSENVANIYVKNGDYVSKGQKIASLEQFKLKNALEQACDNLARAKLELQDVLIGQGYSLNNKAGIPEDVMKIARVKSNYDQSLISYQMAEYNLKAATLHAPFSGVVANLVTKQHNTPDAASAFCTIIDIQNPEVVFMVLENELPMIKKGDKVLISPFSMNDFTVIGRVTEINPSVDENGMVRICASAENTQHRLIDGMNVRVRVQREQGKQLLIPKSALVLRNNRKVVFTAKGNMAQWVYVETGMENSESYVVTDGLQEGDSVIYDGNVNLAHETPIVVIDKQKH